MLGYHWREDEEGDRLLRSTTPPLSSSSSSPTAQHSKRHSSAVSSALASMTMASRRFRLLKLSLAPLCCSPCCPHSLDSRS